MIRPSILFMILVGFLSPSLMADAILTYEPANLTIGEETEVTVQASTTAGDDFGIGQMSFLFAPPPGLSITGFSWDDDLQMPAYFDVESVVSPQTTLISGDFVTVPSGPTTVDLFTITLLVDASVSEGDILELPSDPQVFDLFFSPVNTSFSNDKIEALQGPIANLTFRAVPEPATLGLLLVGGLFGLRRRRRR